MHKLELMILYISPHDTASTFKHVYKIYYQWALTDNPINTESVQLHNTYCNYPKRKKKKEKIETGVNIGFHFIYTYIPYIHTYLKGKYLLIN